MLEAKSQEVQAAEKLLRGFQDKLSTTPSNQKTLQMANIHNRGWHPILNLLPHDILAVGEISTVARALARGGINTQDELLAADDSKLILLRTIGHKRFEIVLALRVMIHSALEQHPNQQPTEWQFLEV